MESKRGKLRTFVFSTLLYAVLFDLVACSSPTSEEMREICELYQFKQTIVAYPSDPQYFIVCAENNGFAVDCGSGNFFEPSYGMCFNNPCTSSCIGKPNGEKLPLNDNCQMYCICTRGASHLMITCPAHQHYSSDEQKCTTPLDAKCQPMQQWCKDKNDGLLMAADKCYEYYECSNQSAVLKTCPYNEYFDKVSNKCVLGGCKDSTEERQPNCADYAEGDKIAHTKCYKYYMCVKGRAFEGQCPTGYYFDVRSKTCIKDVNDECNDV